eukprot:CAMPEP_0113621574 /NCGR_PEP_ID=MMETSP0017_2-20120614/11031_1 /TAXON_ID=2856 /ORGANISM="Cylindrotheca closterium" /LENGTH=707 /DNA_ID=CAMNT_0000531335 /DNA_START=65 /DNA_END=2188 /DNA_ORIENTATION=+ /assembly_acc=CAM_ASM_000147
MTSAILLFLQLGLVAGFQRNLPLSPPCHQCHPTICQQSSASVTKENQLVTTEENIQVSATHWNEQFEELLSFKEEYGHSNFPQNVASAVELNDKYPKLARFCQHQRLDYQQLQHLRQKSASLQKMSLPMFDRIIRCRQLEEIGFEFDGRQSPWYDEYHELLQYRNNNGHVRVKRKENLSLFRWVLAQRARRKGTSGLTKLSDTQIELLNNIGFEWESELYDAMWMEKYNELVDFKNKNGHFLVDTKAGPLYQWITQQRQRRNEKKGITPLSNEQVRLLEEIQFPWKAEWYDSVWYDQYHELERFQQSHGHCKPRDSTHGRLYRWSLHQQLKRDRGVLPTEQIQLLDKINFPWEGKQNNWPRMYQELVDYYNKYGHLRVSEEDDPDLYEWMALQRKLYHGIVKKPAMTNTKIEKLEKLHFCWSRDWKDRTWHEKYTEAVEFYKEYGHAQVDEKANPSLYNWIQTQGKRYKGLKGHKPLSEEELELLEQIDFAFFDDQPRLSWNTMYAELERYREENDGRFPDHKDDPKLNRWMRQQRGRMRCEYGYAQLSDEQKCLLESISCPMLPAAIRRRAWYERYDELVEFWKQHGHFFVENKTLFNWVHRQRVRYKGCGKSNGLPMSKSEVYLLERIGFPWISDRGEVQWQIRYDELVQFLEAEGRFPKDSEHPSLYKWMANQRYRYKGNGYSDLSDHQIQKLEKIGFRWSMTD